MILNLAPLETKVINITGETIAYIDGIHPIEVNTDKRQRSEFPSGSQVRLLEFNTVEITNKGDTDLRANIIITSGEFRKLFEGSTISAEITNAVDVSGSSVAVSGAVDVSGSSVGVSGSVAVSEMPVVDVTGSSVAVSGAVDVSGSSVDVSGSVAVSEMPVVDVTGSSVAVSGAVDVSGSRVIIESMPTIEAEFTEAEISNALVTTYILNAESVITIPARAGRKRLILQGYADSESTALCRVSDKAKTSAEGQLFALGGGLVSELEHKHSDALKVWNTTPLDGIEIITLEEF